MERKTGSIGLSLALLGVATGLYYWGWFAEKRTESPRELPPFTLSSPYWESVENGAGGEASTFDTFFRSWSTRWQDYTGGEGERVRLSLSLLSDLAPPVHCYLWNRDSMVDGGSLRVAEGPDAGGTVDARKLVLISKGFEEVCLYWYMGMKESARGFLLQQLEGFVRRLFQPGERFLMVRVVVPVGEGGEGEATETAGRFIRDAYPSLQRYYEEIEGRKNRERHRGEEDSDATK